MSETRPSTPDNVEPSDSEDDGHPRRWCILGVLCLSLVLTVANNSGLNVALPTLTREIDATQSELQWMIDIYDLIAGVVLVAGALADRYGRRLALLPLPPGGPRRAPPVRRRNLSVVMDREATDRAPVVPPPPAP